MDCITGTCDNHRCKSRRFFDDRRKWSVLDFGRSELRWLGYIHYLDIKCHPQRNHLQRCFSFNNSCSTKFFHLVRTQGLLWLDCNRICHFSDYVKCWRSHSLLSLNWLHSVYWHSIDCQRKLILLRYEISGYNHALKHAHHFHLRRFDTPVSNLQRSASLG